MVDRRTFLISLLLGVASCGSSGSNLSSLQQGRSWRLVFENVDKRR